MPNWVHNRLRGVGKPEEVRGFVTAAESLDTDEPSGERWVLDFERHVGTPEQVLPGLNAATRSPTRSPSRDDSWFHWRRENWGTKWNAMWPSRTGEPGAGEVSYRFATAWTPPEPWLLRVSLLHPDLTFELESVEEFLQASDGRRVEVGQVVGRWLVDPENADWLELSSEDAD